MRDMIGMEDIEGSKIEAVGEEGDADIDLTADVEKIGGALSSTVSRLRSNDDIVDPGPPPDGGLEAWSMAVAAHLVMFNTWGFISE